MSTKKTGPKERTIKWWLAKLPPDIAKMALANTKKSNPDMGKLLTPCLRCALGLAFTWILTPEGHTFWETVQEGNYDKARALLPKPAKKAKAYRATVYEINLPGPYWSLRVNGCVVESAYYATKKSAIRGLRRFAATLGIAVEIEVQE
jgi:hypothetical protein